MKALRIPFLLFALPALACGLAPSAFLYDRGAILRGEWWRLWSGHWVHFSNSHLAWNLLVLVGAGTWLERVWSGLLARYALTAAPAISLGLLAFAPAMNVYGGLSGLAVGVVALLAFAQMRAQPGQRGWWLAVLALTAAKVAVDGCSPAPLFSRFDSPEIHVSALAHAFGAMSALPVALAGLSSSGETKNLPPMNTLTNQTPRVIAAILLVLVMIFMFTVRA